MGKKRDPKRLMRRDVFDRSEFGSIESDPIPDSYSEHTHRLEQEADSARIQQYLGEQVDRLM
ncbi:hypothetical protein GOA61_18085 [Sinorhizobium meliloti]|nr:hypothetical protein [Sinorhizobium meliloti]MDW9877670.1 hypothetical protein [Sinorhizobium meliloti]